MYETIIKWFRDQLHKHDIELIHLTTEEHPGWGDTNYHFQGDPAEPMYNREVFFTRFLKDYAKNGWYWFCEPDFRIKQMFPMPRDGVDLLMLHRPNDFIKISPCFRLARRTAVPFFEEVLSLYNLDKKDWHGDSDAFISISEKIPNLGLGVYRRNGVTIEFRNCDEYLHQTQGKWISHYKSYNKKDLYDEINESRNA